MDDHVHVGHRPRAGLIFLAIETQRRGIPLLARLQLFIEHEPALDKKPRRAAAWVINLHARLGVHDARHDEADLGRRVKLAGALAAALRKLADQILVAAADDIRLDILEAEPLGANRLRSGSKADHRRYPVARASWR